MIEIGAITQVCQNLAIKCRTAHISVIEYILLV